MSRWVPNKEGRLVRIEVAYLKRADDLYARHITRTRECLYSGKQLKSLADFKREQAKIKRDGSTCKRDTAIAEDMEKNADQIDKVLSS